jgi:hypothetical protein
MEAIFEEIKKVSLHTIPILCLLAKVKSFQFGVRAALTFIPTRIV